MLGLKENIIVSTIDFNKKLMETLCEGDADNEEDSCLISGESLEERPIVLNCSHKFNYDSIFKEVRQQKILNQLETTKLKTKEIKCPYCRKIQIGILPWKEGYEKIRYVNWPLKLCSKTNICNHIMKSGKKKGQCCGKPSHFDMCKTHIKLSEKQKAKKIEKEKKVKKCCSIIKSGTRKGECCGSKINNKIQECVDENLCKTHLNSLHKTLKTKVKKNSIIGTETGTKTSSVKQTTSTKVKHKTVKNTIVQINTQTDVGPDTQTDDDSNTNIKKNIIIQTDAKAMTKAKTKAKTNVKTKAKAKVKEKTKAKTSQNKKLNPSKFLFSTMHISDEIFDC